MIIVMCKCALMYYFYLPGLIDYDKILYLVSVPKRHAKSTQSILPQIKWLCSYAKAASWKKTHLTLVVCEKRKLQIRIGFL